MLKVKGIEVFYGHLQALRGVSLEVNRGEVVSILGSNGAGKSTTLMAISGILKPRRGEIQFDQELFGEPMQCWNMTDVRGYIVVIGE